MKLANVCRGRKILPSNIETPLLVPSFSSKGFPNINEIHNYVKDHVPDASLVSAYDLYYKNISHENIYQSDILFIDSGGYESSVDIELSEIYNKEYKPKEWSYDLFIKQISSLEPFSDIALVSYDNVVERHKIDEQINRANTLFSQYPSYARVFLIKPEKIGDPFIDIDKLYSCIDKVSTFSILGITEKELGPSILDRCKNIRKIRERLNDNNIHIPIHIFGCIDPLNILAYFICGADVFDGLSWLRFSFVDGLGYYQNSYAITSGKWSLNDQRLKSLSYGENLKEVTLLMNQMRHFSNTYDWKVFELSYIEELKKLVSQAGIEL